MMLRSLVDEVVRRRLWPILALAIVVAVAAPLLFMKSAPSDAPDASAAPPAAAPGKLPASAEKLVTTSDKVATPRHKSTGAGKDPFAPPASAVAAAAAAAAPAAGSPAKSTSTSTDKAAKKASTKPIPVVITDGNGSSSTVSNTKTTRRRTTTAAVPVDVDTVDVRFGEKSGTKVRRGLKELKTLKVDGKVAAVFVKWSPNREKAVFAIPASTIVSGDVDCRRKEGVCRYVDIPVGKYARLTWLTADGGSYVTRRLDVIRFHRGA
jgi:hypothetical protein